MLLGQRFYAVNDVRVIRISYAQWLQPGYVLQRAVATIPTAVTSTVGSVVLDPTQTTALITLNCGSVVNESFTLNIQAQDTFGQTINDQLNVTIVTAGTT